MHAVRRRTVILTHPGQTPVDPATIRHQKRSWPRMPAARIGIAVSTSAARTPPPYSGVTSLQV